MKKNTENGITKLAEIIAIVLITVMIIRGCTL